MTYQVKPSFYVPLPQEAVVAPPQPDISTTDVINTVVLAGGAVWSAATLNPAPMAAALAYTAAACANTPAEETPGAPLTTYKDAGGVTDNGLPSDDAFDMTSRRFLDLLDGKDESVEDAGSDVVADADGDGEPDSSVNPNDVGPEVTPLNDTELDVTGDGEPDLSVEPNDVGPEAEPADVKADGDDLPDAPVEPNDVGTELDVTGDGEPDLSVEPNDVGPEATPDGTDETVADMAAEATTTEDVAPDQPDTANACTGKPATCDPVAKKITCEVGTPNVQAHYFVKCATQFICTDQGVAVALPDPLTQTDQSVNIGTCTTMSPFAGSCYVMDASKTKTFCGAMDVEEEVNPILFGKTMTPSGVGIPTDTVATFEASSAKGTPINCGVTFQKDGKDIVSIPATLKSGKLFEVKIDNKIPAMSDVCFQPTCTDQAGTSTKGATQCFTTGDKDLVLWMRAKNKTQDISGANNTGMLQGNTVWKDDALLCDGKTAAMQINNPKFDGSNGFTISTQVFGALPSVNGHQQNIFSQWSTKIVNVSQPKNWQVFDAKAAFGDKLKAFVGIASDGKCDYYSPASFGSVLRYCNNKGSFSDKTSWDHVDPSSLGLPVKTLAFSGAFFVDPNVCFVPSQKDKQASAQFLCFNTKGDFNDAKSWSTIDLANFLTQKFVGYEGAVSIGDDVLFPGYNGSAIVRFKSKLGLASPNAWSFTEPTVNGVSGKSLGLEGGVFAHPYVYFSPYTYSTVIRYNTALALTDPKALETVDLQKTGIAKKIVKFAGAANDGTNIIFVPLNDGTKSGGEFIIYDTTKNFMDPASWKSVDFSDLGLPNSMNGNFGGTHTGSYSIFSPTHSGSTFNSSVVALDSLKSPTDAGSWKTFNPAVNSIGDGSKYSGLIYVGGYVRFSPYYGAAELSGQALQLDTTDSDCAYQMSYSQTGNDGGFSGGPYGASCTIKTDMGVFSVSANQAFTSDSTHRLTCTYDNTSLKLFVDGTLVNTTPTKGTLLSSTLPLTVGGMAGSNTNFVGGIKDILFWKTAKSDKDVQGL